MRHRNCIGIFLLAAFAAAFKSFGDAAVYEWYTTQDITLPGGNDIVTGVMAYLVDADVLDQQTVLTSVLGKGKTISETLGSAQLGTAQVSEYGFVSRGNTFSQPSLGSEGHGYFVLTTQLDGENLLYFSGYSSISPSTGVGIGSMVLNPASSEGGINRTTTFVGSMTAGDGGGWYAAVPEPTSGLLMLLGIAALALRRRDER